MAQSSSTKSPKYCAFRELFEKGYLVEAVKPWIGKLATKLSSEKELIAGIKKSCLKEAENKAIDPECRTRNLLSEISKRIQEREHHFDSFVAVLESIHKLKTAAQRLTQIYQQKSTSQPRPRGATSKDGASVNTLKQNGTATSSSKDFAKRTCALPRASPKQNARKVASAVGSKNPAKKRAPEIVELQNSSNGVNTSASPTNDEKCDPISSTESEDARETITTTNKTVTVQTNIEATKTRKGHQAMDTPTLTDSEATKIVSSEHEVITNSHCQTAIESEEIEIETTSENKATCTNHTQIIGHTQILTKTEESVTMETTLEDDCEATETSTKNASTAAPNEATNSCDHEQTNQEPVNTQSELESKTTMQMPETDTVSEKSNVMVTALAKTTQTESSTNKVQAKVQDTSMKDHDRAMETAKEMDGTSSKMSMASKVTLPPTGNNAQVQSTKSSFHSSHGYEKDVAVKDQCLLPEETIDVQSSVQETRLTCKAHFHNIYFFLKDYASHWRDIGLALGFLPNELKNIQTHPMLIVEGSSGYLSDMLNKWLQWAPCDGRESKNFATFEALHEALLKVPGTASLAYDLKAAIFKEGGNTPPHSHRRPQTAWNESVNQGNAVSPPRTASRESVDQSSNDIHTSAGIVSPCEERHASRVTAASDSEDSDIKPPTSFLCNCDSNTRCTYEDFLKGRCNGQLSNQFPYLYVGGLTSSDKRLLAKKLRQDTRKIVEHFQTLVDDIFDFLAAQNVPVGEIRRNAINLDQSIGSQRTQDQFDNLHKAEDVNDLCSRLIQYKFISFLNFRILEKIVDKYGGTSEKKKMREYLDAFTQFCRRSVFEVPATTFPGTAPHSDTKFIVKVSDDWFGDENSSKKFTIQDLKTVQDQIEERIGLTDGFIFARDIREGCVLITFGILSSIKLLPFSAEQIKKLSELHIYVKDYAETPQLTAVPKPLPPRLEITTDMKKEVLSSLMKEGTPVRPDTLKSKIRGAQTSYDSQAQLCHNSPVAYSHPQGDSLYPYSKSKSLSQRRHARKLKLNSPDSHATTTFRHSQSPKGSKPLDGMKMKRPCSSKSVFKQGLFVPTSSDSITGPYTVTVSAVIDRTTVRVPRRDSSASDNIANGSLNCLSDLSNNLKVSFTSFTEVTELTNSSNVNRSTSVPPSQIGCTNTPCPSATVLTTAKVQHLTCKFSSETAQFSIEHLRNQTVLNVGRHVSNVEATGSQKRTRTSLIKEITNATCTVHITYDGGKSVAPQWCTHATTAQTIVHPDCILKTSQDHQTKMCFYGAHLTHDHASQFHVVINLSEVQCSLNLIISQLLTLAIVHKTPVS